MRAVIPKPRFATISCNTAGVGVPLATLARQAFFKFDQDSVITSVTINSNITLNGALAQAIVAVAYNQGENSVGVVLPDPTLAVMWMDETLNPVAGLNTFSKSVQLKFDGFLATSQTSIGLYANGLGANRSINANVSIAYSPFSEWVNFREPRVAVRV